MTFSIIAKCEKTGMFGLAVSSSSPAVAARCAYARAGVGAVSTQNITNPLLGDICLDYMAQNHSAKQALELTAQQEEYIDYRQLLAIDAHGDTHIISGKNTLGLWAEHATKNAASAGNMLDNASIPQAMVDAFHDSRNADAHIAVRLLNALDAALAAGGEAGPVHSAGIKIVDKVAWSVADLRVDWRDNEGGNDCPIQNLRQVWSVYEPQLDAYVKRALNPAESPSYGVPGDE